ncbi:MAG: PepSY domain-containing protein [Nitrospinae bacterium]|nr:PepSY domain-containing protein [Nitrospinota bacterium]
MNMRGLLCGTIAALALALVPFPAAAAEEYGPAEAKALVKQGAILPMKIVVAKAEKLKTGRLLEAGLRKKRGLYVYDVEILDAAGIVWELKFNAATGELLEMEEEKD